MAALGFVDDSDIVAYDDAGGSIAARLWWMLDDLGHARVTRPRRRHRGVDRGGWTRHDRGARVRTPGRLTLRDAWSRTIDREALVARLGAVALVDVRAPERYRGDVEPIDPVAGHIPTAISRPTAGNLGADGRFLDAGGSPPALRAAGQEVVVSCGSGINACHAALAMRVAGLPAPLLYPGSYSDWSTVRDARGDRRRAGRRRARAGR